MIDCHYDYVSPIHFSKDNNKCVFIIYLEKYNVKKEKYTL